MQAVFHRHQMQEWHDTVPFSLSVSARDVLARLLDDYRQHGPCLTYAQLEALSKLKEGDALVPMLHQWRHGGQAPSYAQLAAIAYRVRNAS